MLGHAAYSRAIKALGRALLVTQPQLSLNSAGSVAHWRDNLLPGTEPAWFEAELNDGDGRELDGKFRAAHSSSALAVNTFARFKTAKKSLSISDWSGFDLIQFEAKCSAGIRGGRRPNLDLLLRSNDRVVGVESKCTEHLTRHVATFSPAYDEQIRDWRRATPWFDLMHRLVAEPDRYCYLDAAQLVKHAFGLGYTFDGQDVTLIYLYWEPPNVEDIPELRQHRMEVERFAAEVAGARPAFQAMSYPALWDSWARLQSPEWLLEHVAALRSRYDTAI